MKKAFTLVEMLVVLGIIAVLIGASIASFSKMIASAQKARAREQVSNVATALAAMFQNEGIWPPSIRKEGGRDGILDGETALILAKKGYLKLSTDNPNNPKYAKKLIGMDKFGIITPWAATRLKSLGASAKQTSIVNGDKTILDHTFHFAVDLDGDGVIENANVGGENVSVRATVMVWCAGKDGKLEKYSDGLKKDDVYSWLKGQTVGL